MTAEELAVALDLKPSSGGFRGPCPLHGGTDAFWVKDGYKSVVVYCHAGCDRRELIDLLRDRGLWTDPRDTSPEARRERQSRARLKWAREFAAFYDRRYNAGQWLSESDHRRRDQARAILRLHEES